MGPFLLEGEISVSNFHHIHVIVRVKVNPVQNIRIRCNGIKNEIPSRPVQTSGKYFDVAVERTNVESGVIRHE